MLWGKLTGGTLAPDKARRLFFQDSWKRRRKGGEKRRPAASSQARTQASNAGKDSCMRPPTDGGGQD
ncbi:MAG: hypothetical protein SangKO_054180 [Sandaracinaceae bacterium]